MFKFFVFSAKLKKNPSSTLSKSTFKYVDYTKYNMVSGKKWTVFYNFILNNDLPLFNILKTQALGIPYLGNFY